MFAKTIRIANVIAQNIGVPVMPPPIFHFIEKRAANGRNACERSHRILNHLPIDEFLMHSKSPKFACTCAVNAHRAHKINQPNAKKTILYCVDCTTLTVPPDVHCFVCTNGEIQPPIEQKRTRQYVRFCKIIFRRWLISIGNLNRPACNRCVFCVCYFWVRQCKWTGKRNPLTICGWAFVDTFLWLQAIKSHTHNTHLL